jgi:uncharacterized membrane protein (UPF0127 family)
MLILCLLLATTAGCDRGEPIPEPIDLATHFETGRARIETATDTFYLQVEIAEDEQQRRTGLMRRTSLGPDEGMIFLFQTVQPPEAVFWMFNTLIPLSIAFIDTDGRIGSIVDMEPCPSPYPQYCPNYPAGVSFISALEVNQGWFREHGVTVGDRVTLER